MSDSPTPPTFTALVPAAGQGTRFSDALPKQYIDIHGQPLIFHTLLALARVPRIERIVVILSPTDSHWSSIDWRGLGDRIEVVHCGGAQRAASVLNGLKHLAGRVRDDDWALVHDAARPCLSSELAEQFLDELSDDPVGGLLALPLADTVKFARADQRVERTVARDGLWRAQTPQMFRYQHLVRALAQAPDATDEAQAIEALGMAPKLVVGDSANLKVTYANDLKLARMQLAGGGNA